MGMKSGPTKWERGKGSGGASRIGAITSESDGARRNAEHSGLNPRTFARRFRAATGYRPMEYVHALRIEEVKQFIESETLGIDEISLKVGYDDPAPA